MTAQTVTAFDVIYPWTCEGSCGRDFTVGDTAIATQIDGEWGDDPYGLDPTRSDSDLSTGHVASRWLCTDCFALPVGPEEQR